MRVPKAVVGSSTITASFVTSSCPTVPATVVTSAGTDWVCSFGKLTPGTAGVPQLVLTVVWNIPTTAGTSTTCPECLVTNGRWTIKEGVNDQADPNDAFPPGGKVETATILDVTGATGQVEAGGYQLPLACGNALGAGSLGTSQTVTTTNKVSTTICLPAFQASTVDLGLATTIVEENLDDTNPAGHPNLGRSRVCIATLGQTCGAEGTLHAVPVHDRRAGEVRLPHLERRPGGSVPERQEDHAGLPQRGAAAEVPEHGAAGLLHVDQGDWAGPEQVLADRGPGARQRPLGLVADRS